MNDLLMAKKNSEENIGTKNNKPSHVIGLRKSTRIGSMDDEDGIVGLLRVKRMYCCNERSEER